MGADGERNESGKGKATRRSVKGDKEYRSYITHSFDPWAKLYDSFLSLFRLEGVRGETVEVSVPRPVCFALIGLVATIAFFFIHWGVPGLAVPVPLTLLATVALIALVAWVVQKMSRRGAWNDEHRLALAGGALMFFVLLSPIQELDETRTDNPAGMAVVGLVVLLLLIWLWLRVRRAVRRQAPEIAE